MAKKSFGLGRGLDALLPTETTAESGVSQISLGDIDPNAEQPRHLFDEEALAQLAQSIRDQGVLQPLLVSPQPGGRYRIIAGERRWRASRMAGLDTVPCIVRDMDVIRQMEVALIENLQREDLNPMEEAAGIRALMRQCGYTQEAVAERLCKSRPAVANLLRLLTLPEDLQQMVMQGVLSAGHARVLAGVESDDVKRELAQLTVDKGYSVRQLEALAAQRKKDAESIAPVRARGPRRLPVELAELEGRVRDVMGMRAKLTGNVKKGKIVLQYYSQDELEHLMELLSRLEEE